MVLNDLDCFYLVDDVVGRVPVVGARASYARQLICDKLVDHNNCIHQRGEDLPEMRDWRWQAKWINRSKFL